MQILNNSNTNECLKLLKKVPKSINYNANGPCTLSFTDGECFGFCLNCAGRFCIEYDINEIDCKLVKSFPIDTNTMVCPVSAIFWDTKQQKVIINHKKCIKCGICISRCPIGAIYYDGNIKVNNADDYEIIKVANNRVGIKEQKKFLQKVQEIPKAGLFIKEDEELFSYIYKMILKLNYFEKNILIRNLLIQLGLICSLSRVGDVYTRMDAVFNGLNNNIGVAEIEYGKDTLESARALLDDIAVLHVRYDIAVKNIIPLLVCSQLPNFRQGYWQVVKDINRIEKIKINTISIGALLILMWNNIKINLKNKPIYIDYDNCNLREIIETYINRKISLPAKFLGIFEPKK